MQSKKTAYLDPHSIMKLNASIGLDTQFNSQGRPIPGTTTLPTIERYNKAVKNGETQGTPIEPPRNIFHSISEAAPMVAEPIVKPGQIDLAAEMSAPPVAKKPKTVKSAKKIEKVYRISAPKPSRARKIKIENISTPAKIRKAIADQKKKAALKARVKPAAKKKATPAKKTVKK